MHKANDFFLSCAHFFFLLFSPQKNYLCVCSINLSGSHKYTWPRFFYLLIEKFKFNNLCEMFNYIFYIKFVRTSKIYSSPPPLPNTHIIGLALEKTRLKKRVSN